MSTEKSSTIRAKESTIRGLRTLEIHKSESTEEIIRRTTGFAKMFIGNFTKYCDKMKEKELRAIALASKSNPQEARKK